MAAKKSTDVMIAGKVYTLSGYEEEGYLQHVASYINTKISEITEREEYRRIPNDMKSILIQLNIADDYFKAKKQFEIAEENYKKAEKDLFELKHELVDTQMKVEELLEKLSRERQERSQKSDHESQLEQSYKKLEDKYQLLLGNARVADERNRQFEEMLRLTQQEKREIEAVNKELRLNKEKLEATLADALLGAASTTKDGKASQQMVQERSRNSKDAGTGEVGKADKKNASAEHITDSEGAGPEARSGAAAEPMKTKEQPIASEPTKIVEQPLDAEPAKTTEQPLAVEPAETTEQPLAAEPAKTTEQPITAAPTKTTEQLITAEPVEILEQSISAEPIGTTQQPIAAGSAEKTEQPTAAEPPETTEKTKPAEKTFEKRDDDKAASETEKMSEAEDFLTPTELSREEIKELREAVNETMTELLMEEEALSDEQEEAPLDVADEQEEALSNSAAKASPILITPGLSEEELAELLGPLREPKPAMPELSKEELEELLAPAARYDLTDEGPLPDEDDDEYVSSVLSEVSDDDDPEIQALARQIAELERQEQAEKNKKKKKSKKRKR